jgi:LmbE family N-acetylglucosaminyl deacetylase
MYRFTPAVIAALLLLTPALVRSQPAGTRTLVAVLAHDDDEDPAGPALARYTREGVDVYLLIATDGGQGTGFATARGDTVPRDQELVRMRTEEAQCAAKAIGAKPPILLNFPDGKLGDYIGDRSLTYRLTDRIAMELQRLHPDVIVTWGPEGGMGHPDHRMTSNIVTQLQRASAPGVPERVFFMYIPAEGIQAMNPQRGVPPLVLPDARYVTAHVPYTPEDLQAATRSMACHGSQFTPEIVQRVEAASRRVWNGSIPFIPAFPTAPLTNLFGK